MNVRGQCPRFATAARFAAVHILNAMRTGELTSIAGAWRPSAESFLRDCGLLRRPFRFSSAYCAIIASSHVGLLASLVPGGFLFHATRNRVEAKTVIDAYIHGEHRLSRDLRTAELVLV